MNEDQRNDGSNDGASEKKSMPKKIRTNVSETDEETLVDGGYALANMQTMEAKIDQLLAVLPDVEALKTRLAQVEEENKNLRNAVTSNQEELTEFKISMGNTCSIAADNDDVLRKLRADIQQLRCRNIKLEAYTRRENIKIFNLPEIRGETPSDTEALIKSMFEKK